MYTMNIFQMFQSYNVLKMLRGHLHPPTITTEVYAFNGTIVKEQNTDTVFISIIQYRKVCLVFLHLQTMCN